jgi:predicted DNA-binding antitoxin AbrB/MazE fold protein
MTQLIQAIYEDGVLKPLVPLRLFEHQRVHLRVATEVLDMSESLLAQRKTMEELDTELEALDDRSPDDGLPLTPVPACSANTRST